MHEAWEEIKDRRELIALFSSIFRHSYILIKSDEQFDRFCKKIDKNLSWDIFFQENLYTRITWS